MRAPWNPEDYAILHNNSVQKLGQILGLRGRQVGQMFATRMIEEESLGYLNVLKKNKKAKDVAKSKVPKNRKKRGLNLKIIEQKKKISKLILENATYESLANDCFLDVSSIKKKLAKLYGMINLDNIRMQLGGFEYSAPKLTDEQIIKLERNLDSHLSLMRICRALGIDKDRAKEYLIKKYGTSVLVKIRKILEKGKV